MYRAQPLFRRRLKAAWRQALHRTLGLPCRSHYGLPRELLDLLPRQPLVLLDIGAFEGEFTFGLACWCGIERAVLVEPLPGRADALRRRFATPECRVFGCAVSDQPGPAELRVNAMAATSSLLPIRRGAPELAALELGQEERVACDVQTLDALAAEAGLGDVDLIKIDVQGAELRVLRGAATILQRTRRLWVECSFRPLYDGSATFAEVYEHLVPAGFELQAINPAFRSPTGGLLQVDALFVRL